MVCRVVQSACPPHQLAETVPARAGTVTSPKCAFFLATGGMAVLQLIGCTFKDSADAPGSSKCKLQLVNPLLGRRRSDSASSTDNIANGGNARIGPARIDVFAMVGALLLNKQFRDKMAYQQPSCKVFQVGDNCAGRRCQFAVLITQKVNRKRKLAANRNKTAGDIRPRNGAGVPRLQKQEDSLEGNPN